jgi:hypothetical protein
MKNISLTRKKNVTVTIYTVSLQLPARHFANPSTVHSA